MTDSILAICIPAHGRRQITTTVLRHLNSLDPDGVRLRIAVVASRHDEADYYDGEGLADLVGVAANSPLSEKHNLCVNAADVFHPDAVMNLGSDDLITEAYIEHAMDKTRNTRTHVVRMTNATLYHVETGRCVFGPFYPGSGTVLSRDALYTLDWEPWQGDGIDKHLDRRLYDNITSHDLAVSALAVSPNSKKQLCCLKNDETQIWSFDEHVGLVRSTGRTPTKIDSQDYMDKHFPILVEREPTFTE